jgi:hypothetical protein
MALQTINNGDSGLVARAKINAAIDAINAMSTTTTSTSTTTASPTTTSSTTQPTTTTSSTTTTTAAPTTTTSTTTASPTTSTTTMGGLYNYQINNCAGGSSYTISTTSPLSLVTVYKFYAVGAPYDTNACWTIGTSVYGGTLSTVVFSYNDCNECTGGTTTTSSTSSTSTTTMYYPTSTSSTTMP